MRPVRWLRFAVAALTATTAVLAATGSPALAHHGDIHARCSGNTPVVTERPPGTESVQVTCRNGLPQFMAAPQQVPAFDPVAQGKAPTLPAGFGGWVTVWLNGRPLVTPYNPTRGIQEPGAYLNRETGRVMMPVRFFTAAFGGDVKWSEAERRAELTLKGHQVSLWAKAPLAIVDGKTKLLDQTPVIYLDRMFVPVRFLMETFGATVQWDQYNRSVRIQMDGAACVSPTYCGEAR